ncbi:hypothetical protein RvY_17289 [Ramazzottius varieornatus]|uniref:Alpha N-terminal protein methyltransferase 1 n=1 Tax=Ramazzottius varieornatus TaxID=947166 RepID=A0A1D1W8R6_RAMVA|nr:hypothetical protein RvY_17289 [Ramazzottius varieornatus]
MDDSECYQKASEYWSHIPATVDGMLGGLSRVSGADTSFSDRILSKFLKRNPIENGFVLDVGAGIGRVTKHLLAKHFGRIHMLEADQHFVDASEKYLGPEASKKVEKKFCTKLQDFYPEPETYNCIWIQWVLPHLRDEDFIAVMMRLKAALISSSNAVIFVKENMSKAEDEFDEVDNSVTRPHDRFLSLFKEAGLTVLQDAKQTNFPKNLYEVRLFALA